MKENYLIDYDKVRATKKREILISSIIGVIIVGGILFFLFKVQRDAINERFISEKELEIAQIITSFTDTINDKNIALEVLFKEIKTKEEELISKDKLIARQIKTINKLKRKLNDDVIVTLPPKYTPTTRDVITSTKDINKSKYYDSIRQENATSSSAVLQTSQNTDTPILMVDAKAQLSFVKSYDSKLNINQVSSKSLSFKPLNTKETVIYYSNPEDFRTATLIQSEMYRKDKIKAIVHKMGSTGKGNPIVVK